MNQNKEEREKKAEFEKLVLHYLEKQKANQKGFELEIRFGMNKKSAKPLSKIDYDNVVHQFLSQGWTTDNIEGLQILRIMNEFYDGVVGENGRKNVLKMSGSIRTEIIGSDLIQLYCKTNSIEQLVNLDSMNHKKMKFTEKFDVREGETQMKSIDFTDYNFRVAYKLEQDHPIITDKPRYRTIVIHWNTTRKYFRCINRVRLSHPDYPLFVDISVVKTNNKFVHRRKNRETGQLEERTLPNYALTIQETNLFQNPSTYEIELELDNSRASNYTLEALMDKIRKCIRFVLSGLQETPYPVSYDEQQDVINDYMIRMFGDTWKDTRKPFPFFVGPNSITLQQENIVPADNNIVRILNNYSVTEKADGMRSLLYISKTGKIYMITMNLKVKFTGSITKEKYCFDSLLDGEFILHGKKKEWLYTYAAFDIYFVGGRNKLANVRELDFCSPDPLNIELTFRLPLLQHFVSQLKHQQVVKNSQCLFDIRVKHFESHYDGTTIFEAARSIWLKRHESYRYEVDGLIFTPMNTGVGGKKSNESSELKRFEWDMSFKWKPPQYNTIDFLVQVKQKDGKDVIQNIVQEGNEMLSKVCSYKTLILHCGFNTSNQAVMNPFNDMLYDILKEGNPTGTYEPQPFRPTSPYDPEAHLCYIPLEKDSLGNLQMKTIPTDDSPGEYFQGNMIIEFSYALNDDSRKGPWKWVPIRVRYDKTAKLMNHENEFGNHFKTANSNWRSIHNPVSEEMITGDETIEERYVQDTVYYNRSERISNTRGLRDFHNMYVKRKLIEGLSQHLRNVAHIDEPILMDYAVGKAGDLPKWSLLRFVFGIDISNRNIMDPLDGACVRYLNYRRSNKNKLRGLFLHGNSALNIRSTHQAFYDPLSKEIVKGLFGEGSNSKKYAFDFGFARDGFHISSCQFALHYFFESKTSLHQFMRNISECTRLNGYFVGTCFDGQSIFQLLSRKEESQSIRIEKKGEKIFEITKGYSSLIKQLPIDDTSIGMKITVFQESINENHIEYLVSFTYLIQLMEKYGFVLVDKKESRSIGLPASDGLFDSLFHSMEQENYQKQNASKYNQAPYMTSDEKTISFLNRYFIFKKVRNLSETTLKNLMKDIDEQQIEEEKETKKEEEEEVEKKEVEDNQKKIKPKRTKTNQRIVLGPKVYSPIPSLENTKE